MADYTARSSVVLNGKQAEDQLEALSKRAGTLREEMKKLRKANDLAGFKEKEKELQKVSKEMAQYRKEVFSVDKVLRNLSGASIKDLTTAQRKLNNEMRVMDRNSKEFKNAAKNAALLKNEIARAKIETGQWQSPMQRLLGQAKGLLPAFGIGAIVTGLVRAGKELFNLSSQIQGETIRSVTVFGDQLGYVEQQAEKVAAKMGVTNRQFVTMAASTADLLIPLDFTREQAAKMSTEVQALAGALDEWTAGQIGVTEVSNILTKAMLGQNEQLKQLGIAIRKDSEEYRDLVKQKLETEKVTRAQAEALATLELLYKKSADAQAAYEQEGNKLLRLQKSISLWWKNMKEGVVNYFMENQVDKLRREQEEVNGLVVELRSANTEQERREQIMNRLKQIAPELLKSITDEKSHIEDLTAAVAEYNKEMALKILIAEGEQDIAKQKSKVDAFRNLTAKAEADLARQMKKSLDWFEKKAPGVKQTAEEILFDTQKTLLQKGEELNALALKNTSLGNAALFHSLDSYRTFRSNYSQELNALDILVSETNKSKEEWQKIFGGQIAGGIQSEPTPIGEKNQTGEETPSSTGESNFSATKKALETAFAQELNLLKQQLLDKKITKEEFNQEQYVLELAHLTAMRELYKQYGEDVISVEGQIIDKKLAWQQQFNEMMLLSAQMTEKITADERKMFADIDAEMDEHLNNYIDNLNKETQATINAAIEKTKARQAEKEAALLAAHETGMAAVENANTIKEAGRAILNVIRDKIKAYLAEAVATQVSKILSKVPPPLSLILAAAAAAAVTLAFNKLVPKFDVGGFTGPGGKYKPAGIVHAEEYVIPQEGTKNKKIKPLIDAIETHRKAGTLDIVSMEGLLNSTPPLVINGITPSNVVLNDQGIRDAINYTWSQKGYSRGGSTGEYTFDAKKSTIDSDTAKLVADAVMQLKDEIRQFQKWQPEVAVTMIKKQLKNFDRIERESGL